MKKLLFVNDTLFLGGVEKSLVEIVNQVDFTKFQVDLVIFDTVCEELVNQIDKRVNLVTCSTQKPIDRNPFYRLFRFMSKKLPSSIGDCFLRLCYWLQYRKSIPFIKGKAYHAAIAIKQDSPSVFVSKPFVQANKKILYFRHGCINHPGIYTKTYVAADTIVAVSDGVKKMLQDAYPDAAEKIIALPNHIAFEDIQKDADAYLPECPKDRVILCSCGRLSPEKGFDLAVQAANHLKEKGISFCWYFIGDGPDRQAIETSIRQLGLDTDIILTGTLLNPFPYFKQCDIYVQPSYVEAFGRTITEAMVLLKPVVSTKTLGAEGIITDRQNGILTNMTPEDLGNGICEFIQDAALKERIIQALESIDYTVHNETVARLCRQLYE